MPREKKDAVSVAFRMDREIYERLTAFCEDSGQSKTTAVERALVMYIKDYDEKQALINKSEN